MLNTTVTFAEWDADAQLYRLTLTETLTGEVTYCEAEVLVWAIGGFKTPRFPSDVRGLDRFEGEMWHSGKWRHDVELEGKRVGVIGNGCSA